LEPKVTKGRVNTVGGVAGVAIVAWVVWAMSLELGVFVTLGRVGILVYYALTAVYLFLLVQDSLMRRIQRIHYVTSFMLAVCVVVERIIWWW
jgi:hypothetical protein